MEKRCSDRCGTYHTLARGCSLRHDIGICEVDTKFESHQEAWFDSARSDRGTICCSYVANLSKLPHQNSSNDCATPNIVWNDLKDPSMFRTSTERSMFPSLNVAFLSAPIAALKTWLVYIPTVAAPSS
jgi:hypothetical protein